MSNDEQNKIKIFVFSPKLKQSSRIHSIPNQTDTSNYNYEINEYMQDNIVDEIFLAKPISNRFINECYDVSLGDFLYVPNDEAYIEIKPVDFREKILTKSMTQEYKLSWTYVVDPSCAVTSVCFILLNNLVFTKYFFHLNDINIYRINKQTFRAYWNCFNVRIIKG